MADPKDRSPVSVAEAKAQLELLKDIQKATLDAMAELKGRAGVDQRWLSIGITDLEKGFMSLHRAIFEPQQAEITQALMLDAMKD